MLVPTKPAAQRGAIVGPARSDAAAPMVSAANAPGAINTHGGFCASSPIGDCDWFGKASESAVMVEQSASYTSQAAE